MAAAKLLDLVQVTTSTVGPGTMTLGAAVAPYLTMALAGAVDGSTYTYAINDLGTQSEIGHGVWTSATNTLTRTVLASTNSNAAISLSGSAVVRITPAAEDLVLLDGTGTTNGIPYYTASRGISSTAALTDGQLVVGQTGSAPLPKTMGGDATLSALAALTLASVITAGGPIGSATVTPVITYDAKGRLTTVSQATIAPPFSAITGTAAVTQGGTGTSTAFTTGAVVFAGTSGVYSQDTAFSWDNTLKRLNLNISGSSAFSAETNTQFVLTGADGTATTAFWYSFASPCAIDMMHASGTRASRTATATGSTIGQVNFQGYDTVTATNDGYIKSARLRAIAVPSGATFTSTDHGTDLLFLTTAPGTVTLSEKVRITGVGDLNISAGGGVTIASAAASGNVLRGDGTRFVSATLAAADLSNGVTGSGVVVLATSPTLVTPALGVATATSINKVAITAPASSATLTIADGKTATHNASTTFAGTDGKTLTVSNSGTLAGGDAFTLAIAASKTLTVSNTLTFTGTDSSSAAFGAGGTVAYVANKLSVFAATTSAELAGVISDETGSGALVFGTSPTIATPTITTSAVIPLIGPAADSTTAVKITKADLSTAIVTIDTTNKRVGINKTPGAFDLDVNGAVNLASTLAVTGHVTVEAVTSTGATGTGNLVFSASPTLTGTLIVPTLAGGSTASSALTIESTTGVGTSDSITFQTGSQAFCGTINTSGQWTLGPSTAAPAANVILLLNKNTNASPIAPPTGTLLHVVGVDAAKATICFDGYGTASFSGFAFRQARGTGASPTATQSGDTLGFFQWSGYNSNTAAFGNFLSANGSSILGVAAENWSGATTFGAHVDVKTTPTSAGSTAVVTTRFWASGGFSVGQTATDPGIGAILTNTSIKSQGATAGIGYATGAGGAVTQGTNRTTGVTLNTVTGAITLVSAAGSATAASFTVTDSAVAATDTVVVSQKSGTDKYEIFVTAVAAGSFVITSFTTGGTTTEQPVFNFTVIKGVAA